MPIVQLALTQAAYADALRRALLEDGAFQDWQVTRVHLPDLKKKGVIVVDEQALGCLHCPLEHPERIVLVARDATQLCQAWNAGIVSVVYDNEPLSMAMLAIMAARFRVVKSLH